MTIDLILPTSWTDGTGAGGGSGGAAANGLVVLVDIVQLLSVDHNQFMIVLVVLTLTRFLQILVLIALLFSSLVVVA